VPLHVTRRATIRQEHLRTLERRTRHGTLLANIVRGYGDRHDGGWPLHDALALAAIADPALIDTRSAVIEVDTGVGRSRGQTICAFDMPIEGWSGHDFPVRKPSIAANLKMAVDLDVERFRTMLLDRIPAAIRG
jgi:pyrimidine-specific ribonucleoside hydrolase